jgi:tryptophan synthase beta chain
MIRKTPDANGYYGEFGGAYIPEMLYGNVEELRKNYLKIMDDDDFKNEFKKLLHDYCGRPTPLYYSERLSEYHQTNIYLKREDLNHTGAHKINNTIGQILFARKLGKKKIIAETGAGQHGVATATVCAKFGMDCTIFMGALDVKRQSVNVCKMRLLGAKVETVESGNKTLKDACNEAIREWINNSKDTYYIIGSVVGPHPYPDMVTRFQSIISEEIKYRFSEMTGKQHPDNILACVGGGSNAAGSFYHFIEKSEVNLYGAEAAGKGIDTTEHAATINNGSQGILHGSMSYVLQDKYGQITEPYSISAGLDYPGVGPLHAFLNKTKRAEYIAVSDVQALLAAKRLINLEGIIPAIESAHALALPDLISFNKDESVVICLSGCGEKDLETYFKTILDESN